MRKLSKWKQKYLSFGGRATLIKSVLNSIPFFYFFFQDTDEGGGQVGKASKMVLVGTKLRSEKDRLGELENSLYAKGGRGSGYQRFEEV